MAVADVNFDTSKFLYPGGHLVKIRPSNIAVGNILGRDPLLRDDDVQIGRYFFTQRMLVFNSIDKSVELTRPFTRAVERKRGSFESYFETLVGYKDHFLPDGRLNFSNGGPFM